MDSGSRDLLSQVYVLRDYRSKRSSSWDRSGGNKDWVVIPAKGTHVLLDEPNPGCVRHFYWTYIEHREAARLNIFRGMVLRAFWDEETDPSFEVPLGDFFGVSNGQVRRLRSMGFNCYLPMPFRRAARIEIENQGDCDAAIWYHIDFESYDDAEALPESAALLHAVWRRERKTEAVTAPADGGEIKNLSGRHNYTILDVSGNGQFAGYFLTVVNNERGWWGEGDDMIFIDGEGFPPSIHGTGTEEIFGGGASPVTEYSNPFTGFHCIENRAGYDWWGTTGM
jgi:hypothetical protein